jgi:hypothetical protein
MSLAEKTMGLPSTRVAETCQDCQSHDLSDPFEPFCPTAWPDVLFISRTQTGYVSPW